MFILLYILISGKRDFTDYKKFCKELDKLTEGADEVEIVEGGARGADFLAKRYAKEHNLKLREFPANWNAFGPAAGPIRNQEMVNYIKKKKPKFEQKALFFWDGNSKGTKDCLARAKAAGLNYDICFV